MAKQGFAPPRAKDVERFSKSSTPNSSGSAASLRRVCVDLDPALYKAFRMQSIQDGQTMTDVLREAVQRYVGK